ncbi:MAG: RNA methyltransferase [Bacteroidetes bacterium]|nr:RNA methyltransferase [Bacteroidota bacterium]
MLSRNEIKLIQSLKQKKFRDLHRRFIAEGSKLVMELADSPFRIVTVYALAGWIREHEENLQEKKIPFSEVTEQEMERITALSSPSPALALAEVPELGTLPVSPLQDLVLALDDIRDPGNLGTIIRVADWFGIRCIVCSSQTVDLFNPKVIQATMGSVARVRVEYCNLPEFLSSLDPGTKIYGTFMEGENIYEKKLEPKGILLIGNEAAGISADAAACVTDRISIPSYGGEKADHAESLNAAVATAVVCAEFRRR